MPPMLQQACGPSNSVQHSLFPMSYSVHYRVVWVPCSVGQIVINVLRFRGQTVLHTLEGLEHYGLPARTLGDRIGGGPVTVLSGVVLGCLCATDGRLCPADGHGSVDGHLSPADAHLCPVDGHLCPVDGHLLGLLIRATVTLNRH